MSAKQGLSRINFVLIILGVIWFSFFLIAAAVNFWTVIASGVLKEEVSWAVFLLFLPGLEWFGIGLAGSVFSTTLAWILQGFIDD